MRDARSRGARQWVPALVGPALLGAACWGALRLEVDAAPAWPLGALAAVGGLAALYSPFGRRSLGLGALALPPALAFSGPVACGLLAAGIQVLRWLGGIWLPGAEARRELKAAPAALAGASRLGLAALAAALAWTLSAGRGAAAPGRAAAAVTVYLLAIPVLEAIQRRWQTPGRPGSWARLAAALAIDLGGLAAGVAAALTAAAGGWPVALVLLAAPALVAADAARNVGLRHRAVAQAGELWRVTHAAHRMAAGPGGAREVAAQVLLECRSVVPVGWFQLELREADESWSCFSAGPGGEPPVVGEAQPAESPPALPGIHRRSAWRVLDRRLKVEEDVVGRLRLWCDPRKLEPTAVELLDALLPQIAISVHRALLDRRSRQDPLTGLADRGELEAQLERAFAESRDEGRPLAVVMCDLDRFKRINDRWGHDVGDRALREVASVLEAHRREGDVCCRYGGEEFAVILGRTDGATAQRVAERLRVEVERCVFLHQGRRIPLRMSAGVAAYPELPVRQGRELLVLADEALLKAKRGGRNCSLLHLGDGRFKTADGALEGDDEEAPPVVEPPTLFA